MTSIADVLGGRYQLDRLLGRGGMSDVYQATDLDSGTSVALKLVRSNDPEFALRLAREARVLESFDHPGLIRLLDTGLAGDQSFLVMDLVDGANLARTLERGPLGSAESAALGARLAGALAYVHERGFVHRDVKPSNILLTTSGEAKLGDFGIAAHDDATSYTVTGTTIGTVSYMAPEQLENHQVGAAADVWSLGIVLLECLTGQRAYQGSPSEVMARRIAGPVPLPADLPAPWRQVLSGMLERGPEQRLNATQVAALLATTAFDEPWAPLDSDVTTRLSPVEANDLTSVMPGVVALGPLSGDDTRIVPPRREVVAPTEPRNWWKMSALGVLGVAVLWAAVAFATSNGAPSSAVTTTSTTSTTTTTVAKTAGSTALATLLGDVTSGQSAGTIDAVTGQSIVQSAGAAVTEYVAGQTTLAGNDLQLTASTISNAITSGLITPKEAAVLQSDLAALASALNLSSSVATTTTTTVPAPSPPGPGNGKGHGKGH
jgi:serine/threonine protein kinase